MGMTRRNLIKTVCLAGAATLVKACSKPEPGSWQPAYAKLEARGRLARRIEQAYAILERCELCPRRCGVNRLKGQRGFCGAPEKLMVYSHQPHFGEEAPLVGWGGSGTIFFSNCNLRCVFCQNWPIAHEGWGREVADEDLADMMLKLQAMGCHNINLVTPTHVMPHILNATRIALGKGLRLPLCYNTSGYERVRNIKLLDGIVDIYLPDLKFMDGTEASRYNFAAAWDYPQMAQESIIEMHRQVGDLVTESGIALRGLMVRHLVMPNRVAGTREFVAWVAKNLSKDTYVNIMSQYRVEHKAFEYERIARAITSEEYVEAMEWAIEAGLTNLDGRSLAQLEIHRRRMR
ncbi:MAG: radical SAM protein [Chloroflexi bacterium]|nr:radical SAM protein [Chloroflexota bacterium]